MTFADNISAYLCEAISAEPCFESGKVWGLAELVERNGTQFPVSATRGEGNDIMPDARYPIQVYFRVVSSDREEDSEGYGVQEFRHRMTMRIVAVGDVRTLSGCFNANHAIADLIERAIDLNYTFPNWYNVLTGRIRKNTDKREVLQSEFRGVPWESRILDLFAVALDVEFEGIECPVVCPPNPPYPCDMQSITYAVDFDNPTGNEFAVFDPFGGCWYGSDGGVLGYLISLGINEFINTPVRICGVSYVSDSGFNVSGGALQCPQYAQFFLTDANTGINPGGPGCNLCEEQGVFLPITDRALITDPMWDAGGHVGSITNCTASTYNFGITPVVWLKIDFDCSGGCSPTGRELRGKFTFTINYKEC